MRKHVILLNEDSAKYPNAKRGQFNSSTFRGTWRKPMHTDKLNAHAYRRHPLFYSVHILSTAKFPERFRINSKRYYFNPQKFGIRLALFLASFRNKLIHISRIPKHKNFFLWFAAQNIIARPLGSAMWLVKIHHSFSRHSQTGVLRFLVKNLCRVFGRNRGRFWRLG